MTVVRDAEGKAVAMCQFVPCESIKGYSLDLMRRDTEERPNGILDFAFCATIDYLRDRGTKGLSLSFAAMRSSLEAEHGDDFFQRVERWTVKRLSGIFQIESLLHFNSKYDPKWIPRYVVFDTVEQFAPAVLTILRAESLTEVPVIGKFFEQSAQRQRIASFVPSEQASEVRANLGEPATGSVEGNKTSDPS
jgi:lysyl-tRNA synthetase class 2